MRIACPHCRAVYEVASAEPDVRFLCSRCNNEFSVGDRQEDDAWEARKAQDSDIQLGLFDADRADRSPTEFHHHPADPVLRPPLFLERLDPIDGQVPETGADEQQNLPPEASAPRPSPQEDPAPQKPAQAPAVRAQAPTPSEDDELPAPERRAPRILTWMSWVMLAVAIAGFAYNHASWSQNLWLRSLLLNIHFPIKVHASDWRIPPKSVHAEWLRRDDGSAVLVIEGKVENRLHAELATPWIQVTVYDALHSKKTVRRKTMAITQPPSVDAIQHAPWVPPPQDNVPVAATGSRGFVLVMADLPKQAGEFTLDVVPSLFR